jgi:hypothetical protein
MPLLLMAHQPKHRMRLLNFQKPAEYVRDSNRHARPHTLKHTVCAVRRSPQKPDNAFTPPNKAPSSLVSIRIQARPRSGLNYIFCNHAVKDVATTQNSA